MKRGAPESDPDEDAAATMQYHPPRISNGMVDFDLMSANPHFTCRLCDGYFRDPVTITECLHTFCKSCLYYAFSSGFSKCPTCDVQLGPDPNKSTLHDRTKEELLDRVLFPQLRQQDESLEREFYEKKGINVKAEYLEEANRLKRPRREGLRGQTTPTSVRLESSTITESTTPTPVEDENNNADDDSDDDDVDFVMAPAGGKNPNVMPTMGLDLLQTSGKIKILNLKRFLKSRLELEDGVETIELMVRGNIVGNELSLTFIERTMWLDHNKPLELLYRYATETEV